MRIKTTDILKIWEIEDSESGKIALVKLQESRKVKEENSYDKFLGEVGIAKNGYVKTIYFDVKFIGHAYNKLKDIEIGTAITNVDFEMKKEPYYHKPDKNKGETEGKIVYPNVPVFTVYDFDLYSGKRYNLEFTEAPANKGVNMDKAPKVEESAPEPVAEEVTSPTINPDELPF